MAVDYISERSTGACFRSKLARVTYLYVESQYPLGPLENVGERSNLTPGPEEALLYKRSD